MNIKETLKRIEHENRTWKNKFMRDQAIWEDIAMQINSTKGKERLQWCKVMDLYKQKQLRQDG